MSRLPSFAFALVFLTLPVACGRTPLEPNGVGAVGTCAPGTLVGCTCPNNTLGWQLCPSASSGPSACTCAQVPPSCPPGVVVACTCATGASGRLTCSPTGTFGACVCSGNPSVDLGGGSGDLSTTPTALPDLGALDLAAVDLAWQPADLARPPGFDGGGSSDVSPRAATRSSTSSSPAAASSS